METYPSFYSNLKMNFMFPSFIGYYSVFLIFFVIFFKEIRLRTGVGDIILPSCKCILCGVWP